MVYKRKKKKNFALFAPYEYLKYRFMMINRFQKTNKKKKRQHFFVNLTKYTTLNKKKNFYTHEFFHYILNKFCLEENYSALFIQ